MTIIKIRSNKLVMTDEEFHILQQYLASHDRAGFYLTYHQMVGGGASNETGAGEMALQSKVATFSDTVGAVAWFANRVLQDAHQNDLRYTGIYYLSQHVAEFAGAEVDSDRQSEAGEGVVDSETFWEQSARGAWSDKEIGDLFPGNLLQSLNEPTVDNFLAIASAVAGIVNYAVVALASGQQLARGAFVDWIGINADPNSNDNGGTRAAAAASMYVLLNGIEGKSVDLYANDANYQVITLADGSLRVAVEVGGGQRVVAVEDAAYPGSQGWQELIVDAGGIAFGGLIAAAIALYPAAGLTVAGVAAAIDNLLDATFDPLAPVDWRQTTESLTGPSYGDIDPHDTKPAAQQHEFFFDDQAGADNETLFGSPDNDSINALAGDDVVFGGPGNDVLSGGSGNDVLYGQVGTMDLLDGGAGDEILRGGFGDDVLRPGAGSDVVDGGDITTTRDNDGFDIADYGSSDGVRTPDKVEILLGEGENADKGVITVKDGATTTDQLFSIEAILGTDQSDGVIFKGFLDQQLRNLKHIDGGSQEDGSSGDLLDFSAAPSPIILGKSQSATGETAVELFSDFTLPQSSAQFILNMFIPTGSTTGGGLTGATGLGFTDFEHVIGSAYDDILALKDLAPGGALSAEDRSMIETLLATPIGGFGNPNAVAAATAFLVQAASLIPQNQQNVLIEAGAGDDVVIGTETGLNRIHGGDGVDALYAGGFVSDLHGEAGTDYLAGGGFEAHLTGGADTDVFGLAHNTFVMDATAEDVVTWGSFRLTGGVQQWWMEAGWAYYTPFTAVLNAAPMGFLSSTFSAVFAQLDVQLMQTFRYALSDSGQLAIQFARGRAGQAIIEGYTDAGQGFDLDGGTFVGNITVFQQQLAEGRLTRADLEHYVKLALMAGFGSGLSGTDPLILDLDGDGIELYRRDTASVYFDLDQDGFGERTAWVRPDDGLLARDLNANGIIDDIGELFGDATTPGFDALAALDANADGKITAADAAFASLRVWRDADSDGVTDAGELQTLAEAGITEISLTRTDVAGTTNCHDIGFGGSFTRTDRSTGTAQTIYFATDRQDTVDPTPAGFVPAERAKCASHMTFN